MAATQVVATQKTKVDAGTLVPMTACGIAKRIIDTYTCIEEENLSTIHVYTPPAGSVILGVKIVCAALGTGVTLQLGDTDDDDRYIVAITAATAATLDLNPVAGINYVIGTNDGDDEAIIIVKAANAAGLVTVIWDYI